MSSLLAAANAAGYRCFQRFEVFMKYVQKAACQVRTGSAAARGGAPRLKNG
jgi:hypothetical protein